MTQTTEWLEDKGDGFFICVTDGFTTNSKRGMNIHKAKIHNGKEQLFV